jgi:hypothetical protein
MRLVSRLVLGMGALLVLSACGRVGPVRAPGPPSEMTYPRLYPYFPPTARTGGGDAQAPGGAAAEAPVEQGDLPVVRPASPR